MLYKEGTVLDSLKQLVTELGMEYKPAQQSTDNTL